MCSCQLIHGGQVVWGPGNGGSRLNVLFLNHKLLEQIIAQSSTIIDHMTFNDKHRPERWERCCKKVLQQVAGLELHDPGLQVVEDRHTEVDWVLGPQEKAGQQEFSKCVHVEDVEEGVLEP